MNNMMLYMETQSQIKEVLLVLGQKSNINLVTDMLYSIKLDKLCVCVPTSKLKKDLDELLEEIENVKKFCVPSKFEIISRDKLIDYQKETEEMAVVFDAITEEELIISLAEKKPKYLIGVCHKDEINVLNIWEAYRNYTEQMYIISWKQRDEVLNWKKNRENGIELSVIFPMYNIAKYLPQCIESVTEWKAEYIEFLFVDDGSPDNCAEIVKEYAKQDPRIKLLQKKNGGCASARQFGLNHAKGRYIGFIDPDDYIDPSMYRKLFGRALEGTYEIAYCGYNEFYENTKTTREVPDVLGEPYSEGTSDPTKINELIAYQRVAIWRGIYSRNLIERNKIHFYTDLRRFDDLPFKVEIISKARSVVAVPEYLYYYRMSRPGQDVSADDERLYVHFPIFKYLDRFLKKASDRRQIDYLQLVKVHTHRYALEKIKDEYVHEYCKQAKTDIRSDFGYLEGSYIIKRLGSKYDVLYYTFLYFGMESMIRSLKKPKRKKRNETEKAVKKLKKLNSKGI